MRNYWLDKKEFGRKLTVAKVTSNTDPFKCGRITTDCHELLCPISWSDGNSGQVIIPEVGCNKFRCQVTEDGMLCSGRLSPIIELDDLLKEKEWEVAERYAEKVFFAAGLLKEKVWD